MATLIGIFVSAAALAAPHEAPLQRHEYTRQQMGIPFKLVFYAADVEAANRAADAAFERISDLNRIMSDYDPESELSQLGRRAAAGQDVALSDPLWFVIARSQALAERSDGAFDITVRPYVSLWRGARRTKRLPSAERLSAARARVGYRNLQLDPKRRAVRLLKPGMELDLGGIGVGYAVDEALLVLKQHGIGVVLIDGSGDIGMTDPPPDKSGWTIGVAPLESDQRPSRYLTLANCAVSTSGDAFQHVEIGGRRYSHIIDPKTGLGLTTRLSVVVVANDCITADSLSTAVSVLGPSKGMALVDDTPGAAALFVQPIEDPGKSEHVKTIESRGFGKLAQERVPNAAKQ